MQSRADILYGMEAAVRRLAEEHPDTRYKHPESGSRCSYTSGEGAGAPGCIMGQAARAIGLDTEDWDRGVLTTIGYILNSRFGIRYSETLWLAQVQKYQDMDASWGEAVAQADAERVPRRSGDLQGLDIPGVWMDEAGRLAHD